MNSQSGKLDRKGSFENDALSNMFTTFLAASEGNSDGARAANEFTTAKGRPKRHQVARACVWCRTYRIKCDATYPCKNCKAKGRKCTDEKGKSDVRTFPLALKEIDRLKRRVKELEEQLKYSSNEARGEKDNIAIPPLKNDALALPQNLDPHVEHGGNKKYYNWEYISTKATRSTSQCYGPSSSVYFIGQITEYLNYLDTTFQQPHQDIEAKSANLSLSTPISPALDKIFRSSMPLEESIAEQHLLRWQEESFITIYWQCCHSIYPILDEVDFEKHYNSLWETSAISRRPSPLVDIVLAIGMQQGAALVPPVRLKTNSGGSDREDAIIAGRWLYRRCQSLLVDQLEGPSICTFQSQLLSVLWLKSAAFHNMAHSLLAIGIRSGVILGLHLEPSDEFSADHREFRKRLWWTMYAIEMKMAMELGRPLAVNISQVTCSIPVDNGEHCLHDQRLKCYNAQFVKLLLATRAVYITFYHKCAEVLRSSGHKTLYSDPVNLERCAEFLQSKFQYLQTWLHQLPDFLKMERCTSGDPYSTDRSAPNFYAEDPRGERMPAQSLALELLYHHLCMILYRPFISFSRVPSAMTPRTEQHALSCVNHAITNTNIIYQILTETDGATGAYSIFQWQWDATLSIVGHLLAYPSSSTTTSARKALGTAIVTFEQYAVHSASAANAAKICQDLTVKVDTLIAKYQEPSGSPSQATNSYSTFLDMGGDDFQNANMDFLMNLTMDESSAFQSSLSNTDGFEFSFDTINGLRDLEMGGASAFDWLDFRVVPGL